MQLTNVENLLEFEKKMKFCNRNWLTSFFWFGSILRRTSKQTKQKQKQTNNQTNNKQRLANKLLKFIDLIASFLIKQENSYVQVHFVLCELRGKPF